MFWMIGEFILREIIFHGTKTTKLLWYTDSYCLMTSPDKPWLCRVLMTWSCRASNYYMSRYDKLGVVLLSRHAKLHAALLSRHAKFRVVLLSRHAKLRVALLSRHAKLGIALLSRRHVTVSVIFTVSTRDMAITLRHSYCPVKPFNMSN